MKISLPALTAMVFAGGLSLATADVTAAEFYRWVDSEGVTHYTARPPENQPSETVNVNTGESREIGDVAEEAEADAAAAETGSDQDDKAGQQPPGPTKEELAAQLAREKEQNERNCELARLNDFNLTHRDRIRIKDEESGEERYLSPEELENWRQKTKEELAQYCSS